jgi:hypothetical protein
MNQLKILLSVGLLASSLYAGFVNAPHWIIPLLAIPFTVAYIQGKWYLWKDLFRRRSLKLYRSLLVTYLIQVIVVFVFYLLGSELARFFA